MIEKLNPPIQATVRNRYATNFEDVWLLEKYTTKSDVWYLSNLESRYLQSSVKVFFNEKELEF